MTAIDKYRLIEKGLAAERAGWACEICGYPAPSGERGHILKQSEDNYNNFGHWFIDCSENVKWVHQECNYKADIGNSLDGREEHIQRVIAYLNRNHYVPAHIVRDPITGKEYKVKGMV